MSNLDVWYLFNRDFYIGLFMHNDETDEFSCIVESEGYLVDETIFRLKLDQGSDGIKFAISNVFENKGNKNTKLITWCEEMNWNVYTFDRFTYSACGKGNSNAKEVLITNY